VNNFDASWSEQISNRPGYRKVEDLGLDKQTWKLISQGYTPLQAVNKRMQDESSPSIKRQLDWQLNQLAQNDIENSSDYHHWAMDTGKPQSINPYENQGDMALALKQGNSQEGRLQIAKSNPGVADLFADLPNGRGLEDASWDSAKNDFTNKYPDFTKAVNRVEAAANYPGVYGQLNPGRDYSDWNRSRKANVTVNSLMDIQTGTRRKKTVSGYGDLSISDNFLGYSTAKYKPVAHKKSNPGELALLREMGIITGGKKDIIRQTSTKPIKPAKPAKPSKPVKQTKKPKSSRIKTKVSTFWGI
jgi:hypothetical protein